MKENENEFEINRVAVKRYFMILQSLQCSTIPFMFVFPLLIATFLALTEPHTFRNPNAFQIYCLLLLVIFVCTPVVLFTFGNRLWQRQANNFRYRLDGDTLRVDGGVFFLFRKSIPLERITDVALVQGPLLRFLGIWEMQIQTAGTGQGCEAKLYGVLDPEKVRELILSRRHKIYAEKSGDA